MSNFIVNMNMAAEWLSTREKEYPDTDGLLKKVKQDYLDIISKILFDLRIPDDVTIPVVMIPVVDNSVMLTARYGYGWKHGRPVEEWSRTAPMLSVVAGNYFDVLYDYRDDAWNTASVTAHTAFGNFNMSCTYSFDDDSAIKVDHSKKVVEYIKYTLHAYHRLFNELHSL